MTTLAAAYPAGFCEKVGEIVAEEMPKQPGPWLHCDEVVPLVPVPDPSFVRPARPRRAAVSPLHAII